MNQSKEQRKTAGRSPMGSVISRAATILVILLVGASMGWALTVILAPPRQAIATNNTSLVKVTKQTVESSLTLNTVAQWGSQVVGVNEASGIVTQVVDTSGSLVVPGTILYTVDLRPVVVAVGGVPAFRPLSMGVAGADVTQLQNLLVGLGRLRSTSGTFDSSTNAAVRAWQRQLGEKADGTVELGDVIFVPELPARLSLDPKLIARGLPLAGGETVVSELPASPTFSIPIDPSQTVLISKGTQATIDLPNGKEWDAITGDQETDSEGHTSVLLDSPNALPLCRDDCAAIPISGQANLTVHIHTVPSTTGLAVPTAALRSRSGIVYVIDRHGNARDVRVTATANGVSVVSGIPDGLEIRMPTGG